MRRIGLFLFAVALVVGVAGCSSGGGDSDYNFNGTWIYSERVSAQHGACTWEMIAERVFLEQAGIDVTVYATSTKVDGYAPKGTCTPGGAITWSVRTPEGTYATFTGNALDADTIMGTSRRTYRYCTLDTAWTMELATR
jgi:hypothetical protein